MCQETICSIENRFNRCNSLKILDISGLQLDQADYKEAFDKVSHLRYINLIDTTLSDEIKNIIPKNNIVVCQDEDSNHIIIYYTNDNSDNIFPLLLNEGMNFGPEKDYSDLIISIVVNDSPFSSGDYEIPKMEIYFPSPPLNS